MPLRVDLNLVLPHDVLDQKLKDAGLDQDGKKREGGFLEWEEKKLK